MTEIWWGRREFELMKSTQGTSNIADDIVNSISFYENYCIVVTFTLLFVSNEPKKTLVQAQAWGRICVKPLSEWWSRLLTHICVICPWCVYRIDPSNAVTYRLNTWNRSSKVKQTSFPMFCVTSRLLITSRIPCDTRRSRFIYFHLEC